MKAFKYDNFILSQDQIPLLGGVRGGFLEETTIFEVTSNTNWVNNLMQSASEALRYTKCYRVRDLTEADILSSQRPAEGAMRRLCMKNANNCFKSAFDDYIFVVQKEN